MRLWMIVLAGLLGGFVLDIAWIWSDISTAPSDALLKHLPFLAPVGFISYSIIVLLLATALVVISIRLVRFRLLNVTEYTRGTWTAAFAATPLAKLRGRLLDLVPMKHLDNLWRHDTIVLQSPFNPDAARAEIARLYQEVLAGVYFFAALALLLVITGLGWIQEYAGIKFVGIAIPTGPILVAILALAILAALGRVAVDAAAEKLVDAIASLPLERLDSLLLDTLAELLDRARTAQLPSAALPATSIGPSLDLLNSTIDQCRNSLLEAAARLGENAEALSSAAEGLADHADGAPRIGAELGSADELKLCLEQLTRMVEELLRLAEQAAAASLPAAADSQALLSNVADETDYTRELHQLLREFE